MDGDLGGVEVGWEFEVVFGGLDFGDFEVDFEVGDVEDGFVCVISL